MSADSASISSPPTSSQLPILPGGGWMFNRATDLLIGGGLGYVLTLPVLWWLTSAHGVNAWPTWVFLMISLFISGPHYGATILRAYEHRADRSRYALFAVWATIAIVGLFVAGLHNVMLGSLLVTVYATWSPWHFSGQNYGVAVMFLRRRGVEVEPLAKRLLYASFILAFLLSMLVMHGDTSILSNASVPVGELSNFQFLTIGIPGNVIKIALPIVVGLYSFTLGATAVLLSQKARLRDLGPAACLVLSQALWFALPAAAPVLAGKRFDGLAFTIVWISAAHGLQYLWVSYAYARGADSSIRLRTYFLRTLMAGSAVTIFPAMLFAPGVFGTVPWDNGLAILLISAVNIHHFVLDGAIWKLRDGTVARFLLRDTSVTSESDAIEVPSSRWFHPTIAVVGVVGLGVALFDGYEREIEINQATNVDHVISVSKRLAVIGRDSPALHTQIGRHLVEQGRFEEAIKHYRKGIELFPSVPAWVGLGVAYGKVHRWEDATAAYEEALLVMPDNVGLLAQTGVAYMEQERFELARRLLERAARLAPGNAQITKDFRRAVMAQVKSGGG